VKDTVFAPTGSLTRDSSTRPCMLFTELSFHPMLSMLPMLAVRCETAAEAGRTIHTQMSRALGLDKSRHVVVSTGVGKSRQTIYSAREARRSKQNMERNSGQVSWELG